VRGKRGIAYQKAISKVSIHKGFKYSDSNSIKETPVKKTILLISAFLVVAMLLTACSSLGIIVGSGNLVTKDFDFKDFDKVEVSSALHFDISRSDFYSVHVSTHDNLVPRLDLTQSGKTLVVKLQPGSYSNAKTEVSITMPVLESLEVSGATQGNAKGFQSKGDFTLKVSGASQAEIDIETGKTTLDISGAGKVNGQLKAQDTGITVSGASRC
jgi:hypothetical protein